MGEVRRKHVVMHSDANGVATIAGNLNTSDVSQNVVSNSSFAPPVGVYTLVVRATDNAGNTNVSDPVFFVVYDHEGGQAAAGSIRMKTAHFRMAEQTSGSQQSTRTVAPQAN
ncbi:MAG: hypothetical protein C5S47_01675 [Candidatus Methanogasteraceae archaeon]|nr:MAG: hypothetical protein C5S47_01675 [ANME-2 cluster archaeon]